MDLSTRLIRNNFCSALAFALYFYLQTYDGCLSIISFVFAVLIVKIIMNRMVFPVQFQGGQFPIKRLLMGFIMFHYGVWIVLLIELFKRILYVDAFNGIISMMLMLPWLLGFVFSDSIGICHTNLKNYKRGSLGFEVIQWLKIIVTLLMGSKWVMNAI